MLAGGRSDFAVFGSGTVAQLKLGLHLWSGFTFFGAGPSNFAVTAAFIWPTPCYSLCIDALNVSRAFSWRGRLIFVKMSPLRGAFCWPP